MTQSTSTTIELSPDGTLSLLLPAKDGALHSIPLPLGQAEPLLRRVLAAQRTLARQDVGKAAGKTWAFLLEEGLLANVTKVPQGKSGLGLRLASHQTPEELGL